MDYAEPSTSSAAATPQPPAVEPVPTGSKDGQETLFGSKDMSNRSCLREDNVNGDNDMVIEDIPKKSSSIRSRKKPKQPKQWCSKGL